MSPDGIETKYIHTAKMVYTRVGTVDQLIPLEAIPEYLKSLIASVEDARKWGDLDGIPTPMFQDPIVQ